MKLPRPGRRFAIACVVLLCVGVAVGVVIWRHRGERSTGDVIDLSRESTPLFKRERIGPLAVSSDGRTLAVATYADRSPKDGQLEVWNLETGRLTSRLPQREWDVINAMTFSPDNSLLAVTTAWPERTEPHVTWRSG